MRTGLTGAHTQLLCFIILGDINPLQVTRYESRLCSIVLLFMPWTRPTLPGSGCQVDPCFPHRIVGVRVQFHLPMPIQFSSLLSPSFIAFHIECAYRSTSMGDSNCFQPFFSCREPGLLFGVGQKGRAVWEPRIFTWSMLHERGNQDKSRERGDILNPYLFYLLLCRR